MLKLNYKQKRLLMDDLAYWMLKNGKTDIRSSDAIKRFDRKLANMQNLPSNSSGKNLLTSLVERSGIIRESNPGHVDFIHRTFQEYMAASAASQESDWGLILQKATDDLWHEMIVLAAGFANKKQADELILGLLAEGKKEKDEQFDLLAMLCLETAVEVSAKVRIRVKSRIDALIPPKNKSQIKALSSTGDLVVPFLKFRKDYTIKEKKFCVNLLGLIGGKSALSQLAGYFQELNSGLINEIIDVLRITPPREIVTSNLSKALLKMLRDKKSEAKLSLNGIFINAISEIKSSEIEKTLKPNSVSELEIQEYKDSIDFIFPYFSHLENLKLIGTVQEISNIIDLNKLEKLNVQSDSTFRFHSRVFKSLKNVVSLEIVLSDCFDWPNIEDFVYFPKLSRLALTSLRGPEISFELFQVLSTLVNLKYLHLGFDHILFALEMSELSNIPNLETIEITAPSKCFPEIYISITDLTKLKRVIVNTDNLDFDGKEFAEGLKIALPQCKVTFKEGCC